MNDDEDETADETAYETFILHYQLTVDQTRTLHAAGLRLIDGYYSVFGPLNWVQDYFAGIKDRNPGDYTELWHLIKLTPHPNAQGLKPA